MVGEGLVVDESIARRVFRAIFGYVINRRVKKSKGLGRKARKDGNTGGGNPQVECR